MDKDDAIVGTILNRRAMFGLIARTGTGVVLAGLLRNDEADAAFQKAAQNAVKLVASPAATEGPFFVDEKLRRSNLIEGTTRSSVVKGIPLDLTITLYRFTNGKFAPLRDATVDLWHADTLGVYSDESVPMNHENTSGQNWLRGYQVSDASGIVRFKTIFPGWYPSRTTHIHFKIRQISPGAATKEFTSQLFFEDAVADRVFAQAPYRARDAYQVRNTTDMVFTEQQADGTQAGHHLLLNLQPAGAGHGYRANFAVALTDSNLRSRRGHRYNGPGGPDGPPPFGPPPDALDGFDGLPELIQRDAGMENQ